MRHFGGAKSDNCSNIEASENALLGGLKSQKALVSQADLLDSTNIAHGLQVVG